MPKASNVIERAATPEPIATTASTTIQARVTYSRKNVCRTSARRRRSTIAASVISRPRHGADYYATPGFYAILTGGAGRGKAHHVEKSGEAKDGRPSACHIAWNRNTGADVVLRFGCLVLCRKNSVVAPANARRRMSNNRRANPISGKHLTCSLGCVGAAKIVWVIFSIWVVLPLDSACFPQGI
jgi:hypothetical protein